MRWLMLLLLGCVLTGAHGQTLVVAYNESYEPLSFVQAGRLMGIEVDIMDELGKRTGHPLVHRALPWSRAQASVESGEADAFVTITTKEREAYAVMSKGIFSISNTAVASRNNPKIDQLRQIRTIEDADRFPQVNYLGTGIAGTLLKNAQVTYIAKTESIFSFLISNRADLYIESDLNIQYNASRLKVLQQLEILPVRFNTVDFRLGLSKKSPLVTQMASFEGALDAMVKDGSLEGIFLKYGVHRR